MTEGQMCLLHVYCKRMQTKISHYACIYSRLRPLLQEMIFKNGYNARKKSILGNKSCKDIEEISACGLTVDSWYYDRVPVTRPQMIREW